VLVANRNLGSCSSERVAGAILKTLIKSVWYSGFTQRFQLSWFSEIPNWTPPSKRYTSPRPFGYQYVNTARWFVILVSWVHFTWIWYNEVLLLHHQLTSSDFAVPGLYWKCLLLAAEVPQHNLSNSDLQWSFTSQKWILLCNRVWTSWTGRQNISTNIVQVLAITVKLLFAAVETLSPVLHHHTPRNIPEALVFRFVRSIHWFDPNVSSVKIGGTFYWFMLQ
jgi:hypothetical protein